MCKINLFDKISFLLVIIGAIAWGFIGILNINIVPLLFGGSTLAARIVYILVFASALNLLTLLFRCKGLFKHN